MPGCMKGHKWADDEGRSRPLHKVLTAPFSAVAVALHVQVRRIQVSRDEKGVLQRYRLHWAFPAGRVTEMQPGAADATPAAARSQVPGSWQPTTHHQSTRPPTTDYRRSDPDSSGLPLTAIDAIVRCHAAPRGHSGHGTPMAGSSAWHAAHPVFAEWQHSVRASGNCLVANHSAPSGLGNAV